MSSQENSRVDNIDNNSRAISRTKERKEAKEKFLAFIREDPNVSLACEHIDMSREAVYKWREKDEQFAKDWDTAMERTKDVARSSIYRRAVTGWLEPMVSMGQIVCEEEPVLDKDGNPIIDKRGKPIMRKGKPVLIRKWSDPLAALYAKANLPEYKEKQTIDLNAQITTMADQAKDELLADLAAAIANENKESPNQE